MDYLVEEVLRVSPIVSRHFLLQTSILGRLSGPLCDAVTGQGGMWVAAHELPKTPGMCSTRS